MSEIDQRILEHYEDPYHRGPFDRATHLAERNHAELNQKGCAECDVVVVELRIEDDEVTEAWFDGEGCTISQAAASMLMESIEGKSVDEIEQMQASQMLEIIGVSIEPNQCDCCLLALRALQAAIASPIDEDFDDPTFTGPDLGEEC